MPVNILYIIDSLTHGGTEKQLVQLIRHLDRERFRPHICTLKDPEDLYNHFDIPKICLNFISFAHPSIVRNIISLNSFIRQHKIHIIQTFFQDPFLLAALIKPFHKIKLIGSFRDLGFWRTKTESLKMRLACRFFDGFIANSQAVKDHFSAQDRLSRDQIEVIYNGFDIASIPSPRTDDSSSPEVVGIVANLNRPVKRVEDFVKAAEIIHKKRPHSTFIIVGGGHLQSGLETLALDLGIDHCTIFTGMVPTPLNHVSTFSVGVITSETEGFCNAILEYMACGVPVVATRVGGNPEMVEEDVNGYLYEPGDYVMLANAVLRILESKDEQRRMGTANRRKIAQEYSIEAMVRHTESYYHVIEGMA